MPGMRRFELTDDTSNKFWQVSLDGESTLRVSFGKIGQNGQTQLKTLASAAAATAEMAKLIREKTKKGYAEVPIDDGVAPPPPEETKSATNEKPAPAEAPPVVVQEAKGPFADRFVWTDAARKAADAAASVHTRPPLPAPGAAERIIHDALVALRPDLVHKDAKWDEVTLPVRDRILERFTATTSPELLEPGLEAAAATLMRDGKGVSAFLSRWLGRGGWQTVLENVATMWSWHATSAPTAGQAQPTWLVARAPAENWDSSASWTKRDAADALAAALAREPDAKRADARAAAEKLRAGAALPVRVGLARALDDARFAAEDTEAVLVLPKTTYPHDAKILMRLVDDAALLERLVDRFGFDYTAFRPDIIVRRVGVPAAKVLGRRLEKAGSRPYEIEVANYLATLECAETARILSEWLDKKGVDAVAKAFFARRPDLAFPVLGAAIAARGKPALFAEPAAKTLLAELRSTFDAVASTLDAKALAALRALLPDDAMPTEGESAEDAADGSIPRVLASPPWLTTKKASAPPVLEDVSTLAFEERVRFTDTERAKYGAPEVPSVKVAQWYRLPNLEPGSAAMGDAIRDKIYATNRYLASWVALMSDERALRYFVEEAEVAQRDLSVTPWDLRYLLVRFGAAAIPFTLGVAGRSDAESTSIALLGIESPRVAIFMANALARSKKAKPNAVRYFALYPEASAIGLLPAALAKSTQKVALPALQRVAAKNESVVREVAARHGAKVEASLDALLSAETATPKPPPTPEWFDPARLPPVLLREGEGRLPTRAVGHLGTLLSLCDPREGHDRLDEVEAACTPDSLARFAWGLFQTWLASGGVGKEDWALSALGHFGDDDTARRLAPLIRVWPGESAHARAVKGLDVLARIGSDIALMLLDSIAEKVKFKGLQDKARLKITEVAEERGLSREQLADRIAPTLDLDPNGSRVLSFGPRSFRVGFDEHLVPFVLDESGKRSADLPKPKAADDATVAAESVQTWKALKKDAKTVAQGQIHRLERAMCLQRKWSGEELATLFIAHPLVVHLVRRLVWATYVGDKVERLLRVAEDRTLADAEDKTFTLAPDAVVGLPHRLELSESDIRVWGEIFASYELLQPFPQLERDVYATTDAEREAKELARSSGVEIASGKVIGLTARGWRMGAPQDAGWIWDMTKTLPGDLLARLSLDGGFLAGAMAESPPTQKLGAVVVQRGEHWEGEPLALGEIPPLVFSELVRDLARLED
jgi:predicted DNA-binding WGR domain protein